MIAALAAFALAVAAALAIESWMLRTWMDVPVTGWLTHHMYIPMLRAAAVMVFVVAGYPQLFGLSEAPPLGALLSAHGGFSFLLNLLIVAGLLLSVIPPLHRLPALVLPLQAMIGVGIVFHVLADALGAPGVRYLPDLTVGALIVGIALAAHFAGRQAVHAYASRTGRGAPIGSDAIVFAFQVPAVWLYARFLGSHLTI